MSEYYLDYTGEQLDDAINKVRSGYISPDGLINCNKNFTSGYFEADEDTSISDVVINLGFKPKVFVIRNYGGVQSTTGTYYLTSSFFIKTENDDYLLTQMSDGNANYSRTTMFTYYNGGKACAGQSASVVNTFVPTENGVSGNGSSGVMVKGGNKYIYYALD